MLTTAQKSQFAEALESVGIGITEDDVVETRDRIEDFAKHHPYRKADPVVSANGLSLHVFWREGQVGNHHIVLADFGDARAAYEG